MAEVAKVWRPHTHTHTFHTIFTRERTSCTYCCLYVQLLRAENYISIKLSSKNNYFKQEQERLYEKGKPTNLRKRDNHPGPLYRTKCDSRGRRPFGTAWGSSSTAHLQLPFYNKKSLSQGEGLSC